MVIFDSCGELALLRNQVVVFGMQKEGYLDELPAAARCPLHDPFIMHPSQRFFLSFSSCLLSPPNS